MVILNSSLCLTAPPPPRANPVDFAFKIYLFYFYLFIKNEASSILFIFINLFLAALDLHCFAWACSSCGEWGLVFVVVLGLLITVASLLVEHGF